MSLTPEEIQKIRSAAGVSPLSSGGGSVSSSLSYRLGLNTPAHTIEPKEPTLGEKLTNRYNSAKEDILNIPGNIKESVMNPDKSIVDKVGDVRDNIRRVPLRAVGLAGGAVGDVISSGIEAIGDAIPQSMKDNVENFVSPGEQFNSPAPEPVVAPEQDKNGVIQKAMDKWQQFSVENPEKAKDWEDIGNALNLFGLGGLGKVGSISSSKAGALAKGVAGEAKNIFTKDTASIIKSNIDAINPELSGKKLSEAYKQVVTGDRTIKKAGIFSEQSLSASDRAIKIAERLGNGVSLTDGTIVAPLKLEASSVKNLPKLKTALQNTEAKLQEALLKDPLIKANKDELLGSLQKGLGEAPRDFRIGPNKPITEDVFAFANEVADKADDSIIGLREARSLFDSQAKIQYPTAFKDGAIDTKTAAGNAIKKARDIFNEHLYNTAPNGSDIQKLIGHEADIYQATESVAVKAAKGEGMTKIQKASKAIKDHPVSSVVGAGVAGYGAAKATGF